MGKKLLPLNALEPGMVVVDPVLSRDQQIILQPDVQLTSHMINLLQKWKINSVYIRQDPDTKQKPLTHTTNTLSLVPNYQHTVDTSFTMKYQQAITCSADIFEYMRSKETVPYDTLYQLAYQDLYPLIFEPNLLSYLYQQKPAADYTHLHAVDVGLLAGLLGHWCGLEKQTIQELIMSGVMHDIGKSQIPLSILNKPGRFLADEFEILKLHPVYGYYMLKSLSQISTDIKFAVLQHHERENGNGYPAGLQSGRINPFAKIIALADVYDALTSNRVYRKSVTPFEALHSLSNEIFTGFDPRYCKVFIRNVLKRLTGSTILLNDESQARVLRFDCFMSVKPVVQKSDGSLLDLSQSNTPTIVKIINFPDHRAISM